MIFYVLILIQVYSACGCGSLSLFGSAFNADSAVLAILAARLNKK